MTPTRRRRGSARWVPPEPCPPCVAIPEDDGVPTKFRSSALLAGAFRISKFPRILRDASRSSRNSRPENCGENAKNGKFGITSSFGIATQWGISILGPRPMRASTVTAPSAVGAARARREPTASVGRATSSTQPCDGLFLTTVRVTGGHRPTPKPNTESHLHAVNCTCGEVRILWVGACASNE